MESKIFVLHLYSELWVLIYNMEERKLIVKLLKLKQFIHMEG